MYSLKNNNKCYSSRKANGKRKKTYVGFAKKYKKKALIQSLKKIFAIFSGVLIILILISLIPIGIYFQEIGNSLPDPNELVERDTDQTTIVFDRNMNELYKIHADKHRKFVELEDLPEHFKWAILSAEDIDFYEHKGLDPEAITRASYINIKEGEIVSGASTITQQLVRNTLLYDVLGQDAYEETFTRKMMEIITAIKVEQTFSKDEILQMYINEVGFGGINYGIQAASKTYFEKDAKDLTLAESAMLAGVISSPANYSPIYSSSFELPTRRQHMVLNSMLRHKDRTGVTEEEIREAKEESLEYGPEVREIRAPHFVFYVKRQLEKLYGKDIVERGGLRVRTTLDLSTQQIAQEEITRGVEKYGHEWNVRNGAMIVLDPNTSQIISMVGSVNYWEMDDPRIDGNVNSTIALRQMGSSVKPYTYLAAFERGYSPSSIVPDREGIRFGDYTVRNWDRRYLGDITAREALIKSRNVPAVYLAQRMGKDAFIEMAERLGISTLKEKDRYGLSITLGAAEKTLLEHTAAYSVFANRGEKRSPKSILEIIDANGEVIYQNEKNASKQVVDQNHVDALNWILCDVDNFQDQPLNRYYILDNERKLCGKTGTSDGPRDLSTVQYHKNLVVGVWAGNNNNVEVPGAWSTTVALPISHSFIERVSDKYEPEKFNIQAQY